MSQPFSLPRALWVFLRSPSLRQAAKASFHARAGALWARCSKAPGAIASKTGEWAGVFKLSSIIFGVAFAVIILLCCCLFGLNKLGRSVELWASASAPRLFYAIPAALFDPRAQSALGPFSASSETERSAAQSLEIRLARARRHGAPLIGLAPFERDALLSSLEARVSDERQRRESLADSRIASRRLQSAMLLARLLEEGKTPEQAARALRSQAPPPAPAAEPSASELALSRLRAAIAASPPRRAEELSLSERFSFSLQTRTFAASPLAYAEEQSQSGRFGALLLIGAGCLLLAFAAGWIALRFLSRARALVRRQAPALALEFERQSLEASARPAPKGASSSRRL